MHTSFFKYLTFSFENSNNIYPIFFGKFQSHVNISLNLAKVKIVGAGVFSILCSQKKFLIDCYGGSKNLGIYSDFNDSIFISKMFNSHSSLSDSILSSSKLKYISFFNHDTFKEEIIVFSNSHTHQSLASSVIRNSSLIGFGFVEFYCSDFVKKTILSKCYRLSKDFSTASFSSIDTSLSNKLFDLSF